jgi:hypothetical protein
MTFTIHDLRYTPVPVGCEVRTLWRRRAQDSGPSGQTPSGLVRLCRASLDCKILKSHSRTANLNSNKVNQGESRLFFMTEDPRTIRLGQGCWCTPTGRQAKDTPGRRPGRPGWSCPYSKGFKPFQMVSNRFKALFKKIMKRVAGDKHERADGGAADWDNPRSGGRAFAMRKPQQIRLNPSKSNQNL